MRRIAVWTARLYIWATHRLYSEFAWAYDAVSWLVSLGHWAHWRRTALDYVVGQRILEIGFGTGELLIEMARRGLNGCGIDLSPAMHRITARKMRRRGVQAPRVRALVQRAPFADGSFDTIVATFPAEYIAHPATLREAARLLRSDTGTTGGRLVIVGMISNLNSPFLRWAARFVLGIPVERVLAGFERAAAAAGLHVAVTIPDGTGWRMPVVVAEKQGRRPSQGVNRNKHTSPS